MPKKTLTTKANGKKVKIKPKHKLLLKKISENIIKGMSMREAMEQVGYTEEYAKTSTRLTDTDSWKALMETHLSDEKLAEVHEGLLSHKEWRARDAGLEKGYKLKGRFNNDVTVTHKLGKLSDEEIEGAIAGAISEAIGAIAGETPKEGEQQS